MTFVRWFVQVDRLILYLVNRKLSFSKLDEIMLLMREAITWVPLYLFFLLFFAANCRKFLLPIILLTGFTFGITDFTSASILKPLIGRLRPCHDAALSFQINNIAGCGGVFSMPSSHASNHFGLATFWFLVIKNLLGSKWYWLFLWAFMIGYAQVYVGVHFPGDILVGAIWGILVGHFCWYLFTRITARSANEIEIQT